MILYQGKEQLGVVSRQAAISQMYARAPSVMETVWKEKRTQKQNVE